MAASVRCAWGDGGRRAGTPTGVVVVIGVICAKKKFGICQSVFIDLMEKGLASVIDNAMRRESKSRRNKREKQRFGKLYVQ